MFWTDNTFGTWWHHCRCSFYTFTTRKRKSGRMIGTCFFTLPKKFNEFNFTHTNTHTHIHTQQRSQALNSWWIFRFCNHRIRELLVVWSLGWASASLLEYNLNWHTVVGVFFGLFILFDRCSISVFLGERESVCECVSKGEKITKTHEDEMKEGKTGIFWSARTVWCMRRSVSTGPFSIQCVALGCKLTTHVFSHNILFHIFSYLGEFN